MKETYLSIIRHILSAGGGIATANGFASAETAEKVIGGIIMLIGLVWGAYDEYVAAKKLKTQSPAVQAALK